MKQLMYSNWQHPLTADFRQRGVTLIIALIMLIAMTLAGLATFRQVGTGVIVARNLTFKQAALVAADRGVEDARNWVMGQLGGTLYTANLARGYFSASCNVSVDANNVPDADMNGIVDNCASSPPPQPPFDPLTFDWPNSSYTVTSSDINGNQIRYVIHRLCALPGDIDISNQRCNLVEVDSQSTTKTNPNDPPSPKTNARVYYRVTTRVDGPMNTVAFTQVIFH